MKLPASYPSAVTRSGLEGKIIVSFLRFAHEIQRKENISRRLFEIGKEKFDFQYFIFYSLSSISMLQKERIEGKVNELPSKPGNKLCLQTNPCNA